MVFWHFFVSDIIVSDIVLSNILACSIDQGISFISMWKLEDICAKPPVGTVGNGNKQMERVRSRIHHFVLQSQSSEQC